MSQWVADYRRVDDEALNHVADTMRPSDALEVYLTAGHSPIEALRYSVEKSHFSTAVWINETPCAILGLYVPDVLTGWGVPWLLSSQDALQYRRAFIQQAAPVIEAMLDITPKLRNHVHVANNLSVAWLKRIGFKMLPAVEFGVAKAPFYPFEMICHV